MQGTIITKVPSAKFFLRHKWCSILLLRLQVLVQGLEWCGHLEFCRWIFRYFRLSSRAGFPIYVFKQNWRSSIMTISGPRNYTLFISKQRKTGLYSNKSSYYLFAKPVCYCVQYRLLIIIKNNCLMYWVICFSYIFQLYIWVVYLSHIVKSPACRYPRISSSSVCVAALALALYMDCEE